MQVVVVLASAKVVADDVASCAVAVVPMVAALPQLVRAPPL